MSVKKTVRQIKADAVSAAKNYKVNESSHDYKSGYVRGIRDISRLIEVTRRMALNEAGSKPADTAAHKVMMGYALTLEMLLDAAEAVIPPEYEMGP